MPDERDVQTMKRLLVEYIDVLATRHEYAASEGFEYQLWDQLQGHPAQTTLVSFEEGDEIISLAVYSHSWVTYDLEAGRWRSIDLDDWQALVQKRGHEVRVEELTFYLNHGVFPDGTPEPYPRPAGAGMIPTPMASGPEDIVTVAQEVFGGRIVKNSRHLRKRLGRQGHVLRARPAAEGVYQTADDAV